MTSPTALVETLDEAIELLQKVGTGLEPSLLHSGDAKTLISRAATARNLATALEVALAPLLVGRDPAAQLADLSGRAVGEAKTVLRTGEDLAHAPLAAEAMAAGDLSLTQAAEIAKTEAEVPGSEADLVALAAHQPVAVLRDRARAIRQAAIAPEELDTKRRAARYHRHWTDELGMVRYSGAMLPELGVPFMARLDAETDRVFRRAEREGRREERAAYAADAFAAMLEGKGKGTGSTRRPELVVVVDADSLCSGTTVAGGISKIPGIGAVSPATVRTVAKDAIVSAVLTQGTEFVKIKRWSRTMPVEIATVLALGAPPEFDGPQCPRCGGRFRLEADHVDPHANGGAMAVDNLQTLCPPCHAEKTEGDRRAGLLGRDPPLRRTG